MKILKKQISRWRLGICFESPVVFRECGGILSRDKGLVHENFGGIVGFGGTPFYVSVTCPGDGDSLRVKAVNSIKKSSLNAWTDTTASGKTGSVLKTFKLDTADALR